MKINLTTKTNNMAKTIFRIFACSVLVSGTAFAQIDTVGVTTTAIHSADGAGVVLGSGDYYGSGNDDNFSEYGVTTFNVSDATVASVDAATLTLTYNDRSFSDGSEVEFFFTPDSAETLGGDFANLAYDPSLPNGLDVSQFATAPVSLGVFGFDPSLDGGTAVSYDLDLSAAGAGMLAAVNAGTDFQIIIASTASESDITFSGVGNTFDPGDPALSLSVSNIPEPTSVGMLGFGLLGLLAVRRRR